MISDDDDDDESLDSRIEEAVAAQFDKMVDELASVVQRHADEAINHMVHDRFGELRASVTRTLEAEYTLVKKWAHTWYAEWIYVRDKICSSEDVGTSVEPPE